MMMRYFALLLSVLVVLGCLVAWRVFDSHQRTLQQVEALKIVRPGCKPARIYSSSIFRASYHIFGVQDDWLIGDAARVESMRPLGRAPTDYSFERERLKVFFAKAGVSIDWTTALAYAKDTGRFDDQWYLVKSRRDSYLVLERR